MARRSASVTQADVARIIRAAKQAGLDIAAIRADGTVLVNSKKEVAPRLSAEQARPASGRGFGNVAMRPVCDTVRPTDCARLAQRLPQKAARPIGN